MTTLPGVVAAEVQRSESPITDKTSRPGGLKAYVYGFFVFLTVLALGGYIVGTGVATPSFLLGVFVLDVLAFLGFLTFRGAVLAHIETTEGKTMWESRSFWRLALLWCLLTAMTLSVVAVVSLSQALEMTLWFVVPLLAIVLIAYVQRATTHGRKGPRS